jgi:glycosyltransferase involved in cell wall biosynthesis
MKKYLFRSAASLYFYVDRTIVMKLAPSQRDRMFKAALNLKGRFFDGFGARDIGFTDKPSSLGTPRKDAYRKLPEWAVQEIRSIRKDIDPLFFADGLPGPSGWQKIFPDRPRPGRVFRALQALIPPDATHFIMVPWLKKGGADLVAIKHAEVLCRAGYRPVFLSTEDSDSPWASLLPAGTVFVDVAREGAGLSGSELQAVVARLLVQHGPAVLHVVNSRLGWATIARYGAAISGTVDVFCSLYCDGRIDEAGVRSGYAHDWIPSCDPFVKAYLSDNEAYLDLISRLYGVDRNRTHVMYVPTAVPLSTWTSSARPRSRILWAGRLDRQKKPEILYEVAEAMPDVDFHVYGYTLLSNDRKLLESLGALPNVSMMGPFDGFGSLPIEQMDGYLYTSGWDGVPNVLLEAGIRAMPTVASDVGGIAELVDARTGWLVRGEEAAGYVAALRDLLSSADEACSRGMAMKDLVSVRHSDESFERAHSTAVGYLLEQLPKDRSPLSSSVSESA